MYLLKPQLFLSPDFKICSNLANCPLGCVPAEREVEMVSSFFRSIPSFASRQLAKPLLPATRQPLTTQVGRLAQGLTEDDFSRTPHTIRNSKLLRLSLPKPAKVSFPFSLSGARKPLFVPVEQPPGLYTGGNLPTPKPVNKIPDYPPGLQAYLKELNAFPSNGAGTGNVGAEVARAVQIKPNESLYRILPVKAQTTQISDAGSPAVMFTLPPTPPVRHPLPSIEKAQEHRFRTYKFPLQPKKTSGLLQMRPLQPQLVRQRHVIVDNAKYPVPEDWKIKGNTHWSGYDFVSPRTLEL